MYKFNRFMRNIRMLIKNLKWIASLIAVVFVFLLQDANAARAYPDKPHENVYNDAFCEGVEGEREVKHWYDYNRNGKSYILVDCETDTHVYEGGKDTSSSRDSIHQALFAAALTWKKPAVVIYDTDGLFGRWEYQIEALCEILDIEFIWVQI